MSADSATNSWYKNAVIYAVDISRFYDANGDGRGDIKGLIAKLDYLVELGVTCLWLLPFHSSGGQDNGYDVINYMDIDPSIGSLEDFRSFMEVAKQKGIRVIMDLVVHHTSTHHPWFIAATVDKSVKFRDYYIWTEQLSPDIQEDGAFPTSQDGVWQYDEKTNAYYRHQFYNFEADLNLLNPEVQAEIFSIMDFWLAFGIDGFRIDAAGLFMAGNGDKGSVKKLHKFLEELHAFVRVRNHEAVLIGEADVPFERVPEFFGNGNRFHLLYNFLLNNFMFLSIAIQNASELAKCIRRQAEIRKYGTWVNFIRNADELNLMHLSHKERNRAMHVLAPDPRTQIFGRGIRRRLAPMLEGNDAHMRMTYSLLFALPGTPMLYYGEEIGMGDDVSMKGRNSVRSTMQWSNGVNGGFSGADHSQLIANVNLDEKYGPDKVNVERSLRQKDSLLNFIGKLIRLRRDFSFMGKGGCAVIHTSNPAVLGLSYRTPREHLIILHNFSESSQTFARPKTLTSGYQTLCGESLRGDKLPPFGFTWLYKAKEA